MKQGKQVPVQYQNSLARRFTPSPAARRSKLRSCLLSLLAVLLLFSLLSPVREAADPTTLAGTTQESRRISFFVSNPPQDWQEVSIQIGSDLEKKVEAEIMSDSKTPIYSLYLIDVSIAEEEDRDKCRELLNKLVDHRLDQESISLGLVKDSYELVQDFSQDEHVLKEAIRSLSFNQDQVKPLGALYEGLEQLGQIKSQDGGLGRVVYISNSTESASKQKNLSAVKKLLKAQGSQVYTVAYSYLAGDESSEKEMKELAEQSKARYFKLDTVEYSEITSSLTMAEQFMVASRELGEELQDGSDKKVRLIIETDEEVIRLEDELTMPFGEGSVGDLTISEEGDEDLEADTDDGSDSADSTDSTEEAGEDEETDSEDSVSETELDSEVDEEDTGFLAWLSHNWLLSLIVVLVLILAIILGALFNSRRRVGQVRQQARESKGDAKSLAGPTEVQNGPRPFTPPTPAESPLPTAPPPPAGPIPEAPQAPSFMPPAGVEPLATPPRDPAAATAWTPDPAPVDIELQEDAWEDATVMDLELKGSDLPALSPEIEAPAYDEFADEKTLADLDFEDALDKTFVVPQAYLKLPVVRLSDAENPEEYVEAPINQELLVGRSLQSEPGLEIPASMGRDNNRRRSIGRKHCLITHKDGQYFVEDLNSTNGSFLNGMRLLESTQLQDGDRLTLGLMEFIFQAKDPLV